MTMYAIESRDKDNPESAPLWWRITDNQFTHHPTRAQFVDMSDAQMLMEQLTPLFKTKTLRIIPAADVPN